jgi:hypothetical protein
LTQEVPVCAAVSRGWLGLGLIAMLAGCGRSKAPDLVPVEGQVVYADGSPAAGLHLVFTPQAGAAVPLEATSQVDGTFVPQTLGGKKGAVPGKYRVSFEPAPGADRADARATVKRIPRRLLDDDSSDLVVDLSSSGPTVKVRIPAR